MTHEPTKSRPATMTYGRDSSCAGMRRPCPRDLRLFRPGALRPSCLSFQSLRQRNSVRARLLRVPQTGTDTDSQPRRIACRPEEHCRCSRARGRRGRVQPRLERGARPWANAGNQPEAEGGSEVVRAGAFFAGRALREIRAADGRGDGLSVADAEGRPGMSRNHFSLGAGHRTPRRAAGVHHGMRPRSPRR